MLRSVQGRHAAAFCVRPLLPKTRTAATPRKQLFSISHVAMSSPPHKLCMVPGPVEFHEDVLSALSTPATSHVSPAFIPVFGECFELVRKVFFSEKGQPFIVAGSGTLGWDMIASNLVEPGEEALVLNTGYFGDSFGACLETYGAKVTHIRVDIGDRPTLEQISEALSSGKHFKIVTITHVDTSTGVLTDVKAVSALVHEKSPDSLVIVDGVCSVGCEDLRMDAWGVDVVMTASQKAIGVPPGLCIVVANDRAMETFRNRKAPIGSYYASWANWLPIMNAYEARRGMYFATPPVQLIYGLHTSLKQLTTSSLEERFEQHAQTSKMFKDAVEELGLEMLPKTREGAAHGMTAVYYPKGVQATDLLPKLAAQNVVVAGGLHREIAAKYFRIGHMGLSVVEPQRKHIDTTLAALRSSLKELGIGPSSNL